MSGARIGPLLTLLLILALPTVAVAHEGHEDPELLNHWRTQVHLLVQWAHLAAFGLWVGGMLAATRAPRLGLAPLLFGSWGLFLVSLGSGTYNMEFGAATPDAPDILSWPALRDRWPFGAAYIVLIGAKQALLVVAAGWTAVMTILHLRRSPAPDARLRTAFVRGATAIGLVLAAVTATVLVLHEAIDLAPTPLHSLGGVARAIHDEGGDGRAALRPAPYGTDLFAPSAGLRLLSLPQVAGDVAARFGHLVGFALWLGGNAVGLLAPPGDVRRLVPLLWLGLALQALTGAYQMASWTPFSVAPYPWRLPEMGAFRFGHTYTLVLAVKLALAALAAVGTLGLTLAALRRGPAARPVLRAFGWLNLVVGLALAYAAVTLLLVHEGVDHAL